MNNEKYDRLALPVLLGGRRFDFDLCRRVQMLGETPVAHVWMDLRSLYDPRPGRGGNSWAVVDYFFARCRADGTLVDRGVAESYLLARLLPHARQDGARRVLPDARLRGGPTARRARQELVELLELMLGQGRPESRTIVEFRDRGADRLGIPTLTEAERQTYGVFVAELLDKPVERVAEDPEGAVGLALSRWSTAMKKWGRRAGHKAEKLILDVVSYECRAAFHRAYACVWSDLLAILPRVMPMTAESLRFAQLWHLELGHDSPSGGCRFSWLHGHVFGLHPAGALLMQTARGRRVVGDYLGADTMEQRSRALARLLYGFELSLYAYRSRRQDVAEDRKRRPASMDPQALERAA